MSEEVTQKRDEEQSDKPKIQGDGDIASDLNQIPILSYDDELMNDFDQSLLEGEEAIIDFVEEEESLENEINDAVSDPKTITDDDSFNDESDFLSSNKELDDIVDEIENEIDQEMRFTDNQTESLEELEDENRVHGTDDKNAIETDFEEIKDVQIVELSENDTMIEDIVDLEESSEEDNIFVVEELENQDVDEDEDLEVFTNFNVIENPEVREDTHLNPLMEDSTGQDRGPEKELLNTEQDMMAQESNESREEKDELDLVLVIDIDEEEVAINNDTSLPQEFLQNTPMDKPGPIVDGEGQNAEDTGQIGTSTRGHDKDSLEEKELEESELIDSLDELSEEIISEDDILGDIDETLKEAWGFQDEEELDFTDDLLEDTRDIGKTGHLFSSSEIESPELEDEIEVPILPGEETFIEGAKGPWSSEVEGTDTSQASDEPDNNIVILDEVETLADLNLSDGLSEEVENIIGNEITEKAASDVHVINEDMELSSVADEIEEEYFELTSEVGDEKSDTSLADPAGIEEAAKEDEKHILEDESSIQIVSESSEMDYSVEEKEELISLADLESEITIDTSHQHAEAIDSPSIQETDRLEDFNDFDIDLADDQNEELKKPVTPRESPDGEGLSNLQKEEIKEVLKYIDTLFSDLPSDRVKEFARSKYYDLYNKIFDELGI